MEFKELSTTRESKRFEEHLNFERNNRVILSGIFGIGKTYFIDKFLKEKSENYIPIKINPVNYSVSNNHDIFELIKFDIGYQLFSKNIDFEKVEFKSFFAGQFYVLDNYRKVIKVLTENLARIDHKINAIVAPALELGNRIENYKESMSVNEEKELKDFLEFFRLRSGSPKEENLITDLLCTLIETLKENNKNKEILLIIDDLDRMDPEHIFRILNVFSAHFDYQGIEGENKFGFHKVILICDIENIRGIFHHRYGTDIDFSGYIDKFYSLEIFKYNFSSTIAENLRNFLFNINIKDSDDRVNLKSGESYYVDELSFLLERFLHYNVLSIRQMMNFLKKEIVLPNHAVKSGHGNTRFYVKSTPIFIIFELLESLFGGYKNFVKAIKTTIDRASEIEISHYEGWTDRRIGNVLMLVDYARNNLKISNDPYMFSSDELNLKALYKIEPIQPYGFHGSLIKIGGFKENFDKDNFESQDIMTKFRVNYFKLFEIAYKVYYRMSKVQ